MVECSEGFKTWYELRSPFRKLQKRRAEKRFNSNARKKKCVRIK